MVKIDIGQEEAQAYIELLKDAKLPAEMGYFLTTLRVKISQAFQKDQKLQLIKQITEEKNK